MDDHSPVPTEADMWFCLRAQPKREEIAAAHLRKIEGMTVFAPRLRYQKRRLQEKVWINEPLFPGYLFAQFDFVPLYRLVQLTPGVARILMFGSRYALISAQTIADLSELTGETGVAAPSEAIPQPGEEMIVGAGPFSGSAATVIQWKPARERVQILLETMGRQIMAEVSLGDLLRAEDARLQLSGLART